jgi:hypothetical protein
MTRHSALQWLERGLIAAGVCLGVWCAAILVEARFHNSLQATAPLTITQTVLLPGDEGARTPHPASAAAPASGTLLGRLDAPSVKMSTTILEGTDDATLRHSRFAAWEMGKGFGVVAAFLGGGGPGTALLLQKVREQAIALGVPAPELPQPRHVVDFLIELSADLAADRQCTAASLSSRYTTAHGNLYRFGVAVGYAAMDCAHDLCGPLRGKSDSTGGWQRCPSTFGCRSRRVRCGASLVPIRRRKLSTSSRASTNISGRPRDLCRRLG